MGRKVNPIGFRLGIVSDWESKWFAERNYTEQLHEDIKIRELVMRELTAGRHLAGSSSSVRPTRSMSRCIPPSPASSSASRAPTSSGSGSMLEKEVGKKVHLRIEEIKVPEIDARLIAESIAEQIAPACRVPAGDEACGSAGDASRRQGRQDSALAAASAAPR